MLLEQISEGFVGKFLHGRHAVERELVEGVPGLGIEFPLPSPPGTAEFEAAYDAAHASVEVCRPATTTVSSVPVQGSWRWLMHGVLQIVGLH